MNEQEHQPNHLNHMAVAAFVSACLGLACVVAYDTAIFFDFIMKRSSFLEAIPQSIYEPLIAVGLFFGFIYLAYGFLLSPILSLIFCSMARMEFRRSPKQIGRGWMYCGFVYIPIWNEEVLKR